MIVTLQKSSVLVQDDVAPSPKVAGDGVDESSVGFNASPTCGGSNVRAWYFILVLFSMVVWLNCATLNVDDLNCSLKQRHHLSVTLFSKVGSFVYLGT